MAEYEIARRTMVDRQVRTLDVTDHAIIGAFSVVPREAFVPARQRPFAYSDADLPLEATAPGVAPRMLLAPGQFARLVQLAAVKEGDVVLDVGCATGYSSAILARLAASVVALESDEELAQAATLTLMELSVDNVAVVTGPLAGGYPGEAPYDVILVEGAVEAVPLALLGQLRDGGRLVSAVGRGLAAAAVLYTRSGEDVAGRPVFNIPAPPLPGFERPRAFAF